jgi:NADH:ubiquinone oxidoreductase subunit 2 (subunit N)
METPKLNTSRTATSVDILFPIYALGVVGSLLQIIGAQWDVSWHILGIIETFFTPAHAVLYAGIGLVALANLFGVVRSQGLRRDRQNSGVLLGLRIAIVGILLQLVAAPFDLWWHSVYGFDPFLFTPAHSLLIVGLFLGGTGMSLGCIRLFLAQKSGVEVVKGLRKFSSAVAILALATVLVQINFLSYFLTDVVGMAYTFNICSIAQFRTQGIDSCQFVNQFSLLSSLIAVMLFAAGGTLVFWVSKRLFSRRGIFT